MASPLFSFLLNISLFVIVCGTVHGSVEDIYMITIFSFLVALDTLYYILVIGLRPLHLHNNGFGHELCHWSEALWIRDFNCN